MLYGPYKRKDGRSIVIHYDPKTKKRKTQSYPRYLIEKETNKDLNDFEEVDHINGDRTDNAIDNLQILSSKDNKIKAITETGRERVYLTFICPICDREFKIEQRRFKHNQLVQNKKGPYCSKQCAGKAK